MFKTDATSLNRLMNCNGSRLMGGENSPINAVSVNDGRDEGIAAHWLAQVAHGKTRDECEKFINQKAPNGFFITGEIVSNVYDYLEHLSCKSFDQEFVEYKSAFGNEHFHISCRSDHVGIGNGILHVHDFKYGWRIVEPDLNWTLIAYAIGFQLQNPSAFFSEVWFTIVQPRPNHPAGTVRTWKISLEEFSDYSQQICNTLSNLSETLNTGAHCAKCPALFNCPAARMASMNAIDASVAAYDDNISNDLLSFELDTLYRAKSALHSRLQALEELAMNRSIKGEVITNYTTERSLGNITWIKGLTSEMINALTGVDVIAEKMITPNQAIAKNMNRTAIKALTYRPETGIKLKRITADKKAKRFFAKNQSSE